MGIIAEQWLVDQSVQLSVHRVTGLHRLFGALALGPPAAGHALLFTRCRSVHGAFMRQALDVVFADAGGVVLRVAVLAPWRALACRDAAMTFELARGEAARAGVARGTRLEKNFAMRGVWHPRPNP